MFPRCVHSAPGVRVTGELPGWNAFVFTGTFRPFIETDVNSTVSGSFLRGL